LMGCSLERDPVLDPEVDLGLGCVGV